MLWVRRGVYYGKQCKNSSLHMLPAQKKGDMDAESETVKKKDVSYNKVEFTTVASLIMIANPEHKVPSKILAFSLQGRSQSWLLETYKLMRLGPKQGKVTIYSMEERVSQRPVTPIKLHQFRVRSVLGMAHPCSRFLAYEQAKLKESIVEWAIALDTSEDMANLS
uniref:Uncharacterized protein n=1 Tax=Ananas comosus var. bracteatus TaxID=296719 RepID=A0A6V7PPS1_ANACO|nr:unnamed protein product [Ananas comosus var. bracteatus]